MDESFRSPGQGGEDILRRPFTPQEESAAREGVIAPERLRGGVPIMGEDVIDLLASVEVGENGDIRMLQEVVLRALAFREGLTLGVKGRSYEYDVSEPDDIYKIASLSDLILSTEGAMWRPDAGYLTIEMVEAIEGRIRRAEFWHADADFAAMIYHSKLKREYDLVNKQRRRIWNRLSDENKTEDKRPYTQDEITEFIQEDVSNLALQAEGDYLGIDNLVKLKHHVKARGLADTAFLHRMATCEDPDAAAELGNKSKNTPDSMHWIGFFWGDKEGEFGSEVNKVFEEIVKIGLPNDVVNRLGMIPIPEEVRKQVPQHIYANGFDTATASGVWIQHLLNTANGRMDVVWNAWKFAQTTEVVDAALGEYLKDNRWILTAPPLGNALMTFLAHWKQKSSIELGFDANGKPLNVERFVTHGGLPLIWDKMPDLCQDYLHESSISFNSAQLHEILSDEVLERFYNNLPNPGDSDYDPKYDKLRNNIGWCYNETKKRDGKLKVEKVEISLWDLWLYGRISFADLKFPWYNTETKSPDSPPGEVPPGSFAGWLLKRYRAFQVLKDWRSRPSLNELADPEFLANKLRNCAKVLGKVTDDILPEKNPRALWLGAVLYYHMSGTNKEEPQIVKDEPQRRYRIVNPQHAVAPERAGQSEKEVSTGDIFQRALDCGWLRQVDVDWIKDYFGIVERLI